MSNSVIDHLTSGALSGFCSAVALQPLDLIKTRVQQSDVTINGRHRALAISQKILATNGVIGLWRGTIPTLARNIPGVAMYFYSLQSLRQRLALIPAFAAYPNVSQSGSSSALPKLSNQGNLVAGAVARISVGFLLNPFSVLKARYESNRYTYRSMSEAFGSILRESGPRGFMQGFQASALRDAPYAGIYVLFYELVKEHTGVLVGTHMPGLQAAIYTWSGAMAGALATLTTHPFDVMKTRMQVQSDDVRYRSLRRTVGAILRERGPLGFFDVYETLLIFWRDRAKYT